MRSHRTEKQGVARILASYVGPRDDSHTTEVLQPTGDAMGTNGGFPPPANATNLAAMQLIQIGEPTSTTLHQLIEQMAAQQSSEIEQLKRAALEKHATSSRRVTARRRYVARRARCEQPVRTIVVQVSVR